MKTAILALLTLCLVGCSTGRRSSVTVTAPITIPLPPGFQVKKQVATFPPTPPGAKPKAKALAKRQLTAASPMPKFVPSAVDPTFRFTDTFVTNMFGERYFVAQMTQKPNTRIFFVFGETPLAFPWAALEFGCYPVEQEVWVAGNWPENFSTGFYNAYYTNCPAAFAAPAASAMIFGVQYGETAVFKGVKVKEVIGGAEFKKTGNVRVFVRSK